MKFRSADRDSLRVHRPIANCSATDFSRYHVTATIASVVKRRCPAPSRRFQRKRSGCRLLEQAARQHVWKFLPGHCHAICSCRLPRLETLPVISRPACRRDGIRLRIRLQSTVYTMPAGQFPVAKRMVRQRAVSAASADSFLRREVRSQSVLRPVVQDNHSTPQDEPVDLDEV